jgi:hypothetical protein
MDIKYIETSLGTNNLKDYLIEQINIGKTESEKEVDDIINQVLAKTKSDTLTEEDKSAILFIELIALQKIIYNKEISSVAFYLKNFKSYKTSLFNTKNETSEDDKLATFIIDYYNFINKPDIFIVNELRHIKVKFNNYFLFNFFEKKSERLFEKLNELNYLEKFEWNISTFEIGIIELYKKVFLEKAKSIKNFESKIQLLNYENEGEINNLKSKIERLTDRISKLEGTIEFYEEYHKKYLEHNSPLVLDTYFGDNLLFIFNLYNFLIRNSLLKMTGWSYFFTCMSVNNKEIINLKSSNNLKFIGRIFYFLQDFLQPKYRTTDKKFIIDKFYVDEKPINNHFIKNYIRPSYDKTLNPEFNDIDVFFDNQKAIYIKPNI